MMSSKLKYRETLNYSEVRCILNWLVALSGRQFDRTSTINIRFSPTILGLQHILLPLFHRGLRRHERGGNRRQLFGSFSLIKIQLSQPRPQAFVRYRVTEGGLEPSEIARGVLGEFSRRVRWVTSHLIMRRGRLGTRLQLSQSVHRNGSCQLLQERS